MNFSSASLWRIILYLAKIFGVLAIIFGVYASFVSIIPPKVSVSPSATLDNSNPFLTPFKVTNEGYFSMNSVLFGCAPNLVKTKSGPTYKSETKFGAEIYNKKKVANIIRRGESYTELLPFFRIKKELMPITFADIAVVVSFRYSFLPFRKKKMFRFTTMRNSDGNLQWYSQPIKKD